MRRFLAPCSNAAKAKHRGITFASAILFIRWMRPLFGAPKREKFTPKREDRLEAQACPEVN
jgi:hypothetical protein